MKSSLQRTFSLLPKLGTGKVIDCPEKGTWFQEYCGWLLQSYVRSQDLDNIFRNYRLVLAIEEVLDLRPKLLLGVR